MVSIKPDEISAILRQQLGNFNASVELEEVGTVLQVGDGIARVYGLNNVRAGELVEFSNGVKAIALNLEEDNVGVVLMGESSEIRASMACCISCSLSVSTLEVASSSIRIEGSYNNALIKDNNCL